MKRLAVVIACLTAGLSGCATSFSGSAKVDGPPECMEICRGWGMDLAGMVAMGEYTNGCICKVKGERISINDLGRGILMSSAAGGVAGVYQQMQEE